MPPSTTTCRPDAEATPSQIESLAIRYARAWNRGDVEAIMAMHGEDTSYQFNGGDMCWGRTQVRARFAGQLAAVTDLHFELKSLNAGEGHFVFEFLITGTRGDGAPLTLRGIDLLTVRDGRIVSKHTYAVPAA